MNDLLAKLMAKRGADEDMDPNYKASKQAVLQQLMDEMGKMQGGALAGAKKVTVAAPDSAGLSAGLAKAQDLIGASDPADTDPEDDAEGDAGAEGDNHEHEADDSDPEAASGMAHTADDSLDAMSPEDLQTQIQKLQALLAAKSLK